MREKIKTISLKENTHYNLSLIRLQENFRTFDDLVKFLLNFFITQKTNETMVEQIKTKGLNTN